jgi:N-methylhydantoinase A/oxoprolinase/acetone carboxylase beta subunit
MAAAIRLSLFEKGLDPKDFALISFGGAGGLHACDTAAEIGTGRVVFPRDPGTLSAWGMLFGDVVHDLARSRLLKADALAVPVLETALAELRAEAEDLLARDGIDPADRAFPVTLDLRYPGQAYEIGVTLAGVDGLAPDALNAAVAAFHDAHERQYAHAERHIVPEIVTVRMAATGRLTRPGERPFDAASGGGPKGSRRIRVAGGERDAAVWERAAIGTDVTVDGPAIVEEPHSTLLVPPGWRLVAHPTGALIATCEGL